MRILRSVLDRVVLLAGVLAAGCLPGFIAQYRQRLNGRLDQALLDIAPYQAIADQEQHGSLPALIEYHLKSPDATFHHEGAALQSMMHSVDQLRAMSAAFSTDLAHQCLYLMTHADVGLVQATWHDYQPSFVFDLEAVIFALVVGVLLWAVFLGIWLAIARLMRPRAAEVPSAPPSSSTGRMSRLR
jgi:hypothetical protein